MKKICVFTGAAMGENPIYAKSAYQLGQMIASRQLGLVYGGGKMGLMGRVADGVIEAGGHVTGIIPRFLDSVEIGHAGVTVAIPARWQGGRAKNTWAYVHADQLAQRRKSR